MILHIRKLSEHCPDRHQHAFMGLSGVCWLQVKRIILPSQVATFHLFFSEIPVDISGTSASFMTVYFCKKRILQFSSGLLYGCRTKSTNLSRKILIFLRHSMVKNSRSRGHEKALLTGDIVGVT